MKEINLRNIALLAVTASCLLQVGAQMFAISVVASTISQAPPRSLAILEGPYKYDSSSFWNTVPMITFVLLIIALITNWKTSRLKLIFFALTLFIIGGLLAGFVLEPMFDEIKQTGFSDQVVPALQAHAKQWYMIDWMVWTLGLTAGLALLVALMQPEKTSSLATTKEFN